MLSDFWKTDDQYSTENFKVTPVIRSDNDDTPSLMREYFKENKPMPNDNNFIKVGEHSFLNGRGRILNGRTGNFEFKKDDTVTEQYLSMSCWNDRNAFNRSSIYAYYGNFSVNPLYTLFYSWATHWDGTDVYGEHQTDTPDYSDIEGAYRYLRKIVTYDYSKMFLNAVLYAYVTETNGYSHYTEITLSDYERYKSSYLTFKLIGFKLNFSSSDNTTGVYPILTKTVLSDWITSDTPVSSTYTHDQYVVYPYDLYSNDQFSCNRDYIKEYDSNISEYILDETKIYNMLASYGHIVKSGDITIYPVINNNICDGEYTLNKDDWKSDNSTWTNTDNIPRSGGGDIEDDVEAMQYKLYGTVGGNCRYYRITQAELTKFSVGIQSEDFVEPLKNIVCLNQYPFAVDPHIYNTYSDEDIKIQGKSTGATGRPVTNYIQSWGVDSIDVPNLHNNFLDNSPYTQYELYIPFCGWVQLPDFVHGHTLTVTLLNDIITTSVRGIVQCNLNGDNITVAEKQGVFGTSCPLSSSDEGSKQNALTSAMFNTLGGLASTGFALSTGNAIGTVGGLMSTISAITQGNIANNNNYVSSVGASSDRTVFANYDKIYLKINTVYSNEPDDYNHTYGRPCNKSGKVSDFTGYTTCSHFDTTGLTCSETEKQMIKNLFETGVYL